MGGNQGNMESQNIPKIIPQDRGTLMLDAGHGHPLPAQGTDGVAMGRGHSMPSCAFVSLVTSSVSWGTLRLAKHMLFCPGLTSGPHGQWGSGFLAMGGEGVILTNIVTASSNTAAEALSLKPLWYVHVHKENTHCLGPCRWGGHIHAPFFFPKLSTLMAAIPPLCPRRALALLLFLFWVWLFYSLG